MDNTGYTAHEAANISALGWYNDDSLVREIVKIIEKYHTDELVDVCCGTGYLYPKFLAFYQKIYAVDLSESMLEYNRMYNINQTRFISYTCSDAIKYIKSNKEVIQEKDLLLKNCLQFLNLLELENLLRNSKSNHIFIINTISKSKSNFFDILKRNNFKFVQRTKNYITEYKLDTFCESIGIIKESSIVKQKIPISDWLAYHGCEQVKIQQLTDLLNNMQSTDLLNNGITQVDNQYMLQRYEKVYCINPR